MSKQDELTVARAARVITEHHRRRPTSTCTCGKEWTPRHVAEELHAAGFLVEVS